MIDGTRVFTDVAFLWCIVTGCVVVVGMAVSAAANRAGMR